MHIYPTPHPLPLYNQCYTKSNCGYYINDRKWYDYAKQHLVQLQQWCSHQNPPQRLQYSWRFPEFDWWSCYGIQIRHSLAGQSPIQRGRRICVHPQALQVADWFSMEEHVQSWSHHLVCTWSSVFVRLWEGPYTHGTSICFIEVLVQSV